MIQLSHGYAGFFSFGLLVTLWSASSGLMSLMEALSIASGTRDNRSYVKKIVVAILATVVAALFLIVCFGLWNLGHVMAVTVSNDLKFFVFFQMQWRIIRWVVTLILMSIGINLINHFLPDVKHPWHWFTPGTLVVALSFIGATGVLRFTWRMVRTCLPYMVRWPGSSCSCCGSISQIRSADWSGDRHGVARVKGFRNERMNGWKGRLFATFLLLACSFALL